MTPFLMLPIVLKILDLVSGGQVVPGPDTCPSGARFCTWRNTSRCIREEFWCDGVKDCDRNADEQGCQECGGDAFLCDGKCVRELYRCDGQVDCRNGSDEEGCDSKPPTRTCGYSRTRHKDVFCDGRPDCRGHEDEKNCSSVDCKPGLIWCRSRCVRPSWICDGYKYCPNGEDEVNCTHLTRANTTKVSISTTSSSNTDGESSSVPLVLGLVHMFLGISLVAFIGFHLWRRHKSNQHNLEATVEEEPPYAQVYDACQESSDSVMPETPGTPSLTGTVRRELPQTPDPVYAVVCKPSRTPGTLSARQPSFSLVEFQAESEVAAALRAAGTPGVTGAVRQEPSGHIYGNVCKTPEMSDRSLSLREPQYYGALHDRAESGVSGAIQRAGTPGVSGEVRQESPEHIYGKVCKTPKMSDRSLTLRAPLNGAVQLRAESGVSGAIQSAGTPGVTGTPGAAGTLRFTSRDEDDDYDEPMYSEIR